MIGTTALQGAIAWATSNVMTVATLVLIGLLAWWVVDEREESDDPEETVAAVTSRAQSATKTTLASSRNLMIGLAGIGVTAALEVFQFANELNQALGGAPVLAGHLLFAALTFIGVPTFGISREMLGLMFIVITLLALFSRYGSGYVGGTR